MSEIFERIKELATQRKVRVSAHAFARMRKRGILLSDVMASVATGEVVENYPGYHIGPAVLVLQHSPTSKVLHVVWGVEKCTDEPAVLVTVYEPDPADWCEDFRRRR